MAHAEIMAWTCSSWSVFSSAGNIGVAGVEDRVALAAFFHQNQSCTIASMGMCRARYSAAIERISACVL